MADTVAWAGKTEARDGDAIVEAVAFAAERLLVTPDWRDAIDIVMARLGSAARVSRAYVSENFEDDRGRLCAALISEWCATGVTPRLDIDPSPAAEPWSDHHQRWADRYAQGGMIAGVVAAFPEEEQRGLIAWGVVSVVEFPVMVGGAWWGCIGFDDCDTERDWSGVESDAIRAAATVLGAAVARRRQDEQLDRAEERYRDFVERIPAVTYTDVPADDAIHMGFVSPQIADMLGYGPERFVADSAFWFTLIHPDDRARFDEQQTFDPGNESAFDDEYRMKAADGRWVWVHDASTPVRGDGGEVIYYLGFMTDITERKDAEDAARTAEERFRVLVEGTPAITYQELPATEGGDPGSTMVYVSPQLRAILGYDPATWSSTRGAWMDAVHPDDLAGILETGGRSVDTGEPYRQDYRMIAADGRVVWFHDESHLIRDSEGQPLVWQGVMVDITERKEAEERLRETQERYRALVEHIPAIVYAEPIPPDVDAFYVSPQLAAILGYSPEDWKAVEGFWRVNLHPDDLDPILAANDHADVTGEPFDEIYRFRHADGHYVWLRDEAVRVEDADGTPLFWQGFFLDITEQKEAEELVRLAEERYRALVEQTPAITWQERAGTGDYDIESSLIYVSPQIERILGFTAAEWLEPGFWVDQVHPEDLPGLLQEAERANRTGEPYRHEYRVITKAGDPIWLHEEAFLIRGAGGEPLLWQGMSLDITERKGAEARLMAAEEQFRAVVEHSPAVIYVETPDADPAGFYISPQVERAFGYTAQEWTWTPDFWFDHVHPDDIARVREIDAAGTASFEPFAMDYRFRAKDGSWLWIHDESTFLHGAGDGGFWQGFMLDITARKEAEQQLKEAEEKFRTIVEQSQAVFYVQEIDPETQQSKTTYVAPGINDLIGYAAAHVQDDPGLGLRIVHPEDREKVKSADRASNEGSPGDRFSMEYRMIHKDGRIVWVQDEARLVQIGDGPPYWQGFLLDVTARKEAESQLAHALEVEREATQQLRALDEMKNTFLQAVSHDLRTPLAAILGLAITLERAEVDLSEDDSRDLARRIAENARRLDRLVTNLLDLDRLARGIVAPKLHNTDVGALVRRLLAESDLIADSRLQTDIRPVVIPVDSAKVERIVENLLANTARHTPANATIWVSVAPEGSGALIKVEDNGPGVPESLRETIFEPFQQGPDAPRHSPGVGVGLTLVKRFAEIHGGRAWVEEREGGGASFRVVLPGELPPEPMTSTGEG